MKLALNPNLNIELVRLSDRHACAVIDDFLLNPEEAVAFARAHAAEFEQPERAYPGLVLPVPNAALAAMNRFIQMELGRLFGFCRGGIEFHSQFSLTTLQPRDFSWIQRLPHSDPRLRAGRVNFAALLYLFRDPELGGTGFYRWREPDYWQEMTAKQANDPEAGLGELRERFALFREPARYVTESNEIVELLDRAPARFNRLIFYSGDLPHSAFIEHPERLSGDPGEGRLTLNCFVDALPKD